MISIKSIKKLGLLTIIAASALGMAACTGQASGAESGMTITHELGETIIKGNPQRIVVFDYGLLDILDTIGQDIIGLPKKTLPDYLSKYAGEEYTDAGSLQEPNFEAIYELQPDLILISGRQIDLYDEFSKIAPTVFLTIDGEKYMESFKNNINTIGEIFGKEEELAKQVEEIEQEIKEVKDITSSSDKTGLFVMANDGNLSAFGPGSRFGLLYNELGVLAADTEISVTSHGDKITFEYIVETDPDFLYIMDRAAVAGGDISARQVMDNDLIKSTKAYTNNKMIYLDAYAWYVSSGGVQGTKKMIEEIKSSL